MVLLAKKKGGEPIVLCDKIAQQIPPRKMVGMAFVKPQNASRDP